MSLERTLLRISHPEGVERGIRILRGEAHPPPDNVIWFCFDNDDIFPETDVGEDGFFNYVNT